MPTIACWSSIVPQAAQIERLLARDGTSREQAEEILAAQVSREERLNAAHDVIENTGTLADLERFVQTLHRNYALLAQKLPAPETNCDSFTEHRGRDFL